MADLSRVSGKMAGLIAKVAKRSADLEKRIDALHPRIDQSFDNAGSVIDQHENELAEMERGLQGLSNFGPPGPLPDAPVALSSSAPVDVLPAKGVNVAAGVDAALSASSSVPFDEPHPTYDRPYTLR